MAGPDRKDTFDDFFNVDPVKDEKKKGVNAIPSLGTPLSSTAGLNSLAPATVSAPKSLPTPAPANIDLDDLKAHILYDPNDSLPPSEPSPEDEIIEPQSSIRGEAMASLEDLLSDEDDDDEGWASFDTFARNFSHGALVPKEKKDRPRSKTEPSMVGYAKAAPKLSIDPDTIILAADFFKIAQSGSLIETYPDVELEDLDFYVDIIYRYERQKYISQNKEKANLLQFESEFYPLKKRLQYIVRYQIAVRNLRDTFDGAHDEEALKNSVFALPLISNRGWLNEQGFNQVQNLSEKMDALFENGSFDFVAIDSLNSVRRNIQTFLQRTGRHIPELTATSLDVLYDLMSRIDEIKQRSKEDFEQRKQKIISDSKTKEEQDQRIDWLESNFTWDFTQEDIRVLTNAGNYINSELLGKQKESFGEIELAMLQRIEARIFMALRQGVIIDMQKVDSHFNLTDLNVLNRVRNLLATIIYARGAYRNIELARLYEARQYIQDQIEQGKYRLKATDLATLEALEKELTVLLNSENRFDSGFSEQDIEKLRSIVSSDSDCVQLSKQFEHNLLQENPLFIDPEKQFVKDRSKKVIIDPELMDDKKAANLMQIVRDIKESPDFERNLNGALNFIARVMRLRYLSPSSNIDKFRNGLMQVEDHFKEKPIFHIPFFKDYESFSKNELMSIIYILIAGEVSDLEQEGKAVDIIDVYNGYASLRADTERALFHLSIFRECLCGDYSLDSADQTSEIFNFLGKTFILEESELTDDFQKFLLLGRFMILNYKLYEVVKQKNEIDVMEVDEEEDFCMDQIINIQLGMAKYFLERLSKFADTKPKGFRLTQKEFQELTKVVDYCLDIINRSQSTKVKIEKTVLDYYAALMMLAN